MSDPTAQHLFSYGTLQLEAVQFATFGRPLVGRADTLPGFARSMVKIEDAAVVATSGETHHPIIRRTGDDADRVPGTVFEVDEEDLRKADAYEVSDYRRVEVVLGSGLRSWVYVAADHVGAME